MFNLKTRILEWYFDFTNAEIYQRIKPIRWINDTVGSELANCCLFDKVKNKKGVVHCYQIQT